MIVGHLQIYRNGVAFGCHLVKSPLRAAGERQRGFARRFIDDAYILHEHAALESGPDRLGEGLLGGEALGVGAGARVRTARGLGAFDVGEHPPLELPAPAVERILNPYDVAQVGADADEHYGLFTTPTRPRPGVR